jgi:hypothetical protein
LAQKGVRMSDPERGAGWSLFAGMMLLLMGGFQAFMGLVALLENELIVATPKYLLQLDATSWGWIHMLGGILLLLAGLGIFAGQTWARMVGIAVAALAALANFAFLPYYPIWAIIIITMSMFTIWGLSVWSPPRLD